jgi:hypothetical protein
MPPLPFTLNGVINLKGLSQCATEKAQPKSQKSEDADFVKGECKGYNQVLAILTKPYSGSINGLTDMYSLSTM